jgi:hypothetical protein
MSPVTVYLYDNNISYAGSTRKHNICFLIRCTSTKGVVVNKVVYNDNYSAPQITLPSPLTGSWSPIEDGFPARLDIGEGLLVHWRDFIEGFTRTNGYDKAVVFLDVHTDSGVFRFSAEGCTPNNRLTEIPGP